jgi:hypothetical protein
MTNFDLVEERLVDAKAIAWDTCHKIYVLMDDEQVSLMREYGYGDGTDTEGLITKYAMSADKMLEKVKHWYEESCGLRFVSAVSTMPEGVDANEGFETLIGQFEEEDCEDCGESGCAGVCNDYEDEDEDEDEDEED